MREEHFSPGLLFLESEFVAIPFAENKQKNKQCIFYKHILSTSNVFTVFSSASIPAASLLIWASFSTCNHATLMFWWNLHHHLQHISDDAQGEMSHRFSLRARTESTRELTTGVLHGWRSLWLVAMLTRNGVMLQMTFDDGNPVETPGNLNGEFQLK